MNNISHIPAICFGEILWDMLPDGPQPGGAPLNVAYHMNKLGMPTSILSKVGKDVQGDELIALLDSWGIDKQFLQFDDNYKTGEVIAKMNNGNEVSYDILFPVAWDYIEKNSGLKDKINSSSYIAVMITLRHIHISFAKYMPRLSMPHR